MPAPPDEATTQPGDLWILGDHRLLCGDSSKPEDVDRLLDGATIHLVNTDPPYNVKVEPRSQQRHRRRPVIVRRPPSITRRSTSPGIPRRPKPTQKKLRAKDRPLANDFVSDEEFDQLLDAWFGNMARVLEPGRGFYIWGGYANCGNYPPVLKKHGLYFSPGDHLGQAASGADAQGLHGQPSRSASTAGRKAPPTSSSGPTTPPTCGT